jgi:hypothetical protein
MEKLFEVINPMSNASNEKYPAKIQKILSWEANEKLLFSRWPTLIPP